MPNGAAGRREANVGTYEANIEQDRVNAAAPDLPSTKPPRPESRNAEGRRRDQQALDNANRDYLAALNKRDGPSPNRRRYSQTETARAQVLQSQASLKQLEEQLSYTTIVAPMDASSCRATSKWVMPSAPFSYSGSTATLVMTEGDINQVYVQARSTRPTSPTST